MSYDLFFRPRGGSVDAGACRDYFTGRGYRVEAGQAWYANEDTGVYFVFDLPEEGADFAFNLNYFRPHFFVLEAEPEVAAFVRAFELEVSDPQIGGMGEGEYRSAGLIAGWNQGNRLACQAMLSQDRPPADVLHLPSAELERIWRWNRDRRARQQAVGDGRFVPMIMLFRMDGRAVTAAVWTDGIPLVVPPVDYLMVHRHQLAPRRLLLFRREEIIPVSWADAAPVLESHGGLDADGVVTLNYDAPPEGVAGWIRSLPSRPMPGRVPADQVIDRELIEAFPPPG
jgi:hypothetical protein